MKTINSLAITALVALPVTAQDLGRQAVVALVARQVEQLVEQLVPALAQRLEQQSEVLQQQL